MRRTNFFCPRCFVFRIYPLYLFPKIWFRRPLSEARMKREPGAIPGQSRCCEAPQHSEHLSHWPRAGKASEQEPVRRPAKSIRHRTRPWDGRSISEVFHQDEELTRRCAPFRPADAVAGIRLPRCRTRPRLPAAGEKGQQRAGQEVRQEGRTGGRTGIISGRPRTADKGASHEKGCTAGKRPATGAHHRRRGTVQAPVPTGTRPLKRHELLARHEFRHGTSPARQRLSAADTLRHGRSSLHGTSFRNDTSSLPLENLRTHARLRIGKPVATFLSVTPIKRRGTQRLRCLP